METTILKICSKEMKRSHIQHGVDIPAYKLDEFPQFPEGKNYVPVPVTDEAGWKWNFRLARRSAKPLKPIIASTDWFKFVKTNRVHIGDTVTFYKEINRATGEVIGYKVKLEAPGAVRILGSVCGRDDYIREHAGAGYLFSYKKGYGGAIKPRAVLMRAPH